VCDRIFPIPNIFRFDADLYLYALALTNCSVYYVHNPLAFYRKHPGAFTELLSKDRTRMELDLRLKTYLIDLLKRSRGEEATPILQVIENESHRRAIVFEKKRGSLFKVFKHIINGKIEGPLMYKLFSLPHLFLFLFTPEGVYRRLKHLYRTLGLKRVMMKVLRKHLPF